MVWCLILAKILHDKVFTIFMSLECTRLGLLPRMSQILTCLSDDDVTRHPLIWLLRSKPARKSKALNVVCFVFFYTDWTKKVKTHRTLLHRAPSVWKQVYPSEHPNSKQSRHLCWPGEKKKQHTQCYSGECERAETLSDTFCGFNTSESSSIEDTVCGKETVSLYISKFHWHLQAIILKGYKAAVFQFLPGSYRVRSGSKSVAPLDHWTSRFCSCSLGCGSRTEPPS